MKFLVLSTSRGTTFQGVIDALKNGGLTAECLGLVTDREDRECIEKASAAGLPVAVVGVDPKEDRKEFDRALDSVIQELTEGEDVILAEMGWMWIHTEWFTKKWENRIINVHPSLLPKFGGEGMYGHHVHEAVLAAGERESGVTFHIVTLGVDEGKILEQKSCSIEDGETAESLQQKAQSLEKEWYPKVLQSIEEGRVDLSK